MHIKVSKELESVTDLNVNISKYNPLAGSSYIKKGFINIQNIDDNECFKRRLIKYLHPVDLNERRITKADQLFGGELDFKYIKIHNFQSKLETFT